MSKEAYTDSFLTDAEKVQVTAFIDNKVMAEAIRKILLAGLYENGVLKPGTPKNPSDYTRNYALSLISRSSVSGNQVSNEELGAGLRAIYEAFCIIENGFSAIANYGTEAQKKVDNKNPAR